jgi:hypothetical protein
MTMTTTEDSISQIDASARINIELSENVQVAPEGLTNVNHPSGGLGNHSNNERGFQRKLRTITVMTALCVSRIHIIYEVLRHPIALNISISRAKSGD